MKQLSRGMKILASVVVGVLLLSSFGLSAWLLDINAISTANVLTIDEGDKPLLATTFDDVDINTTESSAVGGQQVIITNPNPAIDYDVIIGEMKTLNENQENCTGYMDDCSVDYYGDETLLNLTDNQTEVSIATGDTIFSANYSCVRWSCGQQINVEWDWIPIE